MDSNGVEQAAEEIWQVGASQTLEEFEEIDAAEFRCMRILSARRLLFLEQLSIESSNLET